MKHRFQQWAGLTVCLIFTMAIGSANAKPSAPKTSFGSFSKSSSTSSAHVAPVAPGRSDPPTTSFGRFKSSPALAATPALPVQATKAVAPLPNKMAADMQANAAKANALKTLDQRNAVSPSTSAVTGMGSGSPAPTYAPQQTQPAQPPMVVYQNSSGGGGLGSMVTGFMLGRMLSPSHPYNNGTNRDYPSNAQSNGQRTDWDSGNVNQSYFPWGLFILLVIIVGFAVYIWRKHSVDSDEPKPVRYSL